MEWQYIAPNPLSFFASHISGAQRLPNGNTLICNGEKGYFFEVTEEGATVWDYQNTYPSTSVSYVFKIQKYGFDYPGLASLFEKPQKPSLEGPTKGSIDNEYTYVARSSDPDSDILYYLFDWGDGSDSGWIGPVQSGVDCEVSYQWNEDGEFEVKVKAKDENGLESAWSDPLQVSMPHLKQLRTNVFDVFDLIIHSLFSLVFSFS